MQTKIELKSVSKRFSWTSKGVLHEVDAVDDVSLTIRENEFLTMIGPSLFPWKTVLDNVKFPLMVRKVADTDATEIAHAQLWLGHRHTVDQNPARGRRC